MTTGSDQFLRHHQAVSYGHILNRMTEWLEMEQPFDEEYTPDTMRDALEWYFAECYGMYEGDGRDGDVDYTADLHALADLALAKDKERRETWAREGWSKADDVLEVRT